MVALLISTACHYRPSAFDQALAQANERTRQGDITGARESYQEATETATTSDEEVEARYRAILLGKDPSAARSLVELARAFPSATRAPRCLLDAGRIYRRSGHIDQAMSAFRELITSYPSSASASSGLREILNELRKQDPSGEAERSFIAENRERLVALREELDFRAALALEESDVKAAILAYEDLARSHPLPEGRYTDEALLRAAKLRLSKGDAAGALAVTDAVMRANEKSLMVGSYTRSSYAEAAYLRATILRDHQKDRNAAAKAFERFPSQFPRSRLRDDALHAAAEIYRAEGRRTEACVLIRRLAEVDPDSRFRRSEGEYCD